MNFRSDSASSANLLRTVALPLFLVVQTGLLFFRLDLLPVWGDEHFTLEAAAQPLSQLLRTVGVDIHPPFYYLLVHFWLMAPLPASPLVAVRALSVLAVLATTIVIDRSWLSRLETPARMWFLSLWVLSPCLLLYGRMARSYSLQVLLAWLAVYLAIGFLDNPGNRRRLLTYTAAAAALLYLHYLPGVAVALSVTLLFLWRSFRQREPRILIAPLGSLVLLGIVYAPWMPRFAAAIGNVARARPYSPVAATATGEALKLGYWFFSFNFGETPSLWVIAGAALVSPMILVMTWKALRRPPEWFGLLVPLSFIAYIGTSHWVSFPFVPARLLFLLPFYFLLLLRGWSANRRAASLLLAGMLCLSTASAASYFGGRDFLNKGYIVRYDEIAALVNEQSSGQSTAVVADLYNTDPWPMLARLRKGTPVITVTGGRSLKSLLGRIREADPGIVWYFRNTHDISPGRINEQLETALAGTYTTRKYSFAPYSSTDRWLIRLLGWRNQPACFVQLLRIERQPAR